MPPRKQKKEKWVKRFMAVMVVAVVIFLIYIIYLWQHSRDSKFVTYKEFGIPMPTHYGIHGIDVSRYQQRISWKAVRNMNVEGIELDFAFIKATEGSSRVDPWFKRNWQQAKQAGIVRGAYHFFIPWKDGKQQAENFIKTVDLKPGDLPPVLDIEQLSRTSVASLKKELKEWLALVEARYGAKPIIYTNADFYTHNLGKDFDAYPLWVAHYLQRHQPRIKRNWDFWQHSESGRVDGILSKVDFNVFNGDTIEFKSLLLP